MGPLLGAALVALSLVAARAATLTVATYNVENYTLADRLTEWGYRREYPKPEAEKTALRAVIRTLGADVLFLQEVGGPGFLEELQRDLAAEGFNYPYRYLLEGHDAERHVAVLSRRPFKQVVPHVELRFPYFGRPEPVKRGLVEVVLALPGGDLTLFGVHLKSRFTDRADDPLSALRRVGEATAIRDAILARVPDPAAARFLILGDCNDGRTSKTLQRLTQRGKTEIARLLPAADTRGETWTHAYRKEDQYTRVDHILASPRLWPAVAEGKARIHDGPGVADASDHRPVVVVLDLDQAR